MGQIPWKWGLGYNPQKPDSTAYLIANVAPILHVYKFLAQEDARFQTKGKTVSAIASAQRYSNKVSP